MSKYIETQTRKIIGSYGGIGSIIETPKGALIIEHFDKWPFFNNAQHIKEENRIEDFRLLNRLKFEKGFPNLKAFVKVPTNVGGFANNTIPQNPQNVISARYFPEWFYCPKCERFHKISKWWEGWRITLQQSGKDITSIRNMFYEKPKCYYCYKKNNGKLFVELEQVRFVLTSPNGEITDIPWERWNLVQKKANNQDSSDSGSIKFDFENFCCDNQDLRYIRSAKYSDLAGIRIECKSCGKKQTLSGLFGIRLPVFLNKEGEVKQFKKPVIRTSNSVYYPIIISSIFLPTELKIKIEDANEIDEWLEEGESQEFIVKVFKKKGYSEITIIDYINNKNRPIFEPEIEYRLKEYNFMTNSNRIDFPEIISNSNNLIFEKQNINTLSELGIENLIKLKKIKITVVQTAYTRQEPMDKDQFLKGDYEKVKPKYTSKWNNQTQYLPAVENFGEGIFINFDTNKIEKWLDEIINEEKFIKRIRKLQNNAEQNDLIKNDRFLNLRFLAKFVMIHTLSHLLIKEFEFSVGYPATSLNERLYINNNQMSGLMLYTVAGSEGSFGGLISQANELSFKKILKSALYRAKDCASDPVCYNTIDGQGVGGLNMAACYSCVLVPDISCEEFNSFLDRALLIDSEFGYFRSFF
ncbi:MAG: DUF1998 domain-containing protein [Melioribacteraceae bacterium]|nr:DUF1998 domain-containing protein [Melioribacteraceae bacterium]